MGEPHSVTTRVHDWGKVFLLDAGDWMLDAFFASPPFRLTVDAFVFHRARCAFYLEAKLIITEHSISFPQEMKSDNLGLLFKNHIRQFANIVFVFI